MHCTRRTLNLTLVYVSASFAIARKACLARTCVAIGSVRACRIGAACRDPRRALVDVALVHLGNSEQRITSTCADCEQAARETSHHVSHYNATADMIVT